MQELEDEKQVEEKKKKKKQKKKSQRKMDVDDAAGPAQQRHCWACPPAAAAEGHPPDLTWLLKEMQTTGQVASSAAREEAGATALNDGTADVAEWGAEADLSGGAADIRGGANSQTQRGEATWGSTVQCAAAVSAAGDLEEGGAAEGMARLGCTVT